MIQTVIADYADPGHAAAIPMLLDAYARDPMGGGRALSAHVLAALIPGLSGNPQAFTVLAYDAGEPAGLANCFEGFSTFAGKPLVNIHDLVVSPAHRRRGIGAALLDAVDAEARRRGCCKVTLEVLEGNRVARALYERQGFARYALDPAAGHALFLEKKLAG